MDPTPTTDDLVADARRRKAGGDRPDLPIWARALFHGIDLGTFIALPALTALATWATDQQTLTAAWISGSIGVVSSLRLWLKRSPLVRDLGLESSED
jgi:hypothetical protein